MRYEIIVEVNGVKQYLDTYDYEPISLTYNIADVREIANRNTSYSKTITLPETPNNRQVFGFISDLSSDSTFNPNKKSPVWILCDTIVVLNGNIQLTNINTDYRTGETKFECVVYSETDNFFKEMGDLYLTDLDWSDLNHQFTPANVKATWTASNTYKDGYYYPLIDYGNGWAFSDISGGSQLPSGVTSSTQSNFFPNSVDMIDMKPATYVRRIWDKIFSKTGYQYQSEFLDSELFNNLIIPSNAVELYPSATASQFSLGLSSSFTLPTAPLKLLSSTSSNINFDNPTGAYNSNGQFTISSTFDTKITDDIILNLNLSLRFDHLCLENIAGSYKDDSTQLTFTIYRDKNPTTGVLDPTWNSGKGYVIDQPFIIQTPVYQFDYNNNYWYKLASSRWNDGIYGNVGVTQSGNSFYNQWYLNFQTSLLDGTSPARAPLRNGDRIRVVVEITRWKNAVQQNTNPVITLQFNNSAVPGFDTFLYSPDTNIPLLSAAGVGADIDYLSSIPKKVKQKDFITSIIRMFNLYIEPSKEWRKTLIIEPRDDYYASGTIKDWTNKIDLNSPIDIKPISDLQSKQIILTHKLDKDYLNTDYKLKTNEIYGQHIYDIDNDFIVDVKTIETIFSPTPLSEVSNSGLSKMVIPRITKDYNGYNYLAGGRTEHNIRILLKSPKGFIPFERPAFGQWSFNNEIIYYGYPYAGHLNNPFTPTLDINFGQLKGLYYGILNLTNKTLYNDYWKAYLDEISDKNSKIVSCMMYLTANDIYNFKFNDNIYLTIGGNGQYYKVNKIDGYDPGANKLTKVELLKSKTIPTNKTHSDISTSGFPIYTGDNPIGTIVNGPYNTVKTSNVLVVGSGNVVTEPSAVFGDNNISTGQNFIFGSNNQVNNEGVFVIGNDITNTQPNTTYINSNFVILGTGSVLNTGNIVVNKPNSITFTEPTGQATYSIFETTTNYLHFLDSGIAGQSSEIQFGKSGTLTLRTDNGTENDIFLVGGGINISHNDISTNVGDVVLQNSLQSSLSQVVLSQDGYIQNYVSDTTTNNVFSRQIACVDNNIGLAFSNYNTITIDVMNDAVNTYETQEIIINSTFFVLSGAAGAKDIFNMDAGKIGPGVYLIDFDVVAVEDATTTPRLFFTGQFNCQGYFDGTNFNISTAGTTITQNNYTSTGAANWGTFAGLTTYADVIFIDNTPGASQATFRIFGTCLTAPNVDSRWSVITRIKYLKSS